jgi:hypothetical protein
VLLSTGPAAVVWPVAGGTVPPVDVVDDLHPARATATSAHPATITVARLRMRLPFVSNETGSTPTTLRRSRGCGIGKYPRPSRDGATPSAAGTIASVSVLSSGAYALAALDEAAKFVPPGIGSVPESALWTESGRALWQREPDRFRLAVIDAYRDVYRDLITSLNPAAPEPPRQPEPGRKASGDGEWARFGSALAAEIARLPDEAILLIHEPGRADRFVQFIVEADEVGAEVAGAVDTAGGPGALSTHHQGLLAAAGWQPPKPGGHDPNWWQTPGLAGHRRRLSAPDDGRSLSTGLETIA